MEELVKVSFVAVLGVLAAIQFKGNKPEYSTYIGLAMGLMVFGYVVNQLRLMLGSFSWIGSLFEGADGYLAILLKVIGITYLCEFAASVCKDAGYSTVADQIEVLGKLSVMFAGLPILLAVIEQIQSYMG